MQVNHKIFGTGTILSQDDKNVVVDFAGQVKTLVTKFANLTNIDGTPFYTEVAKVNKFTAKKAPATPVPVLTFEQKQKKDIELAKSLFLTVNDQYNSNSRYKLACSILNKVNSNGNQLIESLLDSFFAKNFLSEKQAYILAKFAVETKQF